ncbi:nucleotidyltransferase family protein [soil metagenome]
MDAMILAAGLGTRLGDVTRDTPKALVEVAGRTALEHVAGRLIAAGADRIIINVHHHAPRIIEHVEQHAGFGVDVVFSREEAAPLETGGGLLRAAPYLRRDQPFFLHNVDVLCNADLATMYAAHSSSQHLATLAVSRRSTSRYLVFDGGRLTGRSDARTGKQHVAFAGIHVISPAMLERISETGAFSIMDVYMRLAAAGEHIGAHDISSATWLEIGTPERLEAARQVLGSSSW